MPEQNIFSQLEETKELPIIQTAKGTVQIQQTYRNKLKVQIEDAVQDILRNALPDTITVDRVKDGIALGIMNEETGEIIPIVVDLTIKSLDYNIEDEIDSFKMEQQEKQVKAEKAAAAKAKKIESDRLLRERQAAKKNA
jgi:hypothetical protein